MLRAIWRPIPLGRSARGADAAEGEDHAARRLRSALNHHYADVWRVIRRLGVPESVADDAAQSVFVVAASKLARIEPGKERSFLLATASRVAANHRRSAPARYECVDEDTVRATVDDRPSPEVLLDEKRLRVLLDQVLEALPDDLRTVLVLFELEEVGLAEIAVELGIPRGTVSSRLRRGREAFAAASRRLRKRLGLPEESP